MTKRGKRNPAYRHGLTGSPTYSSWACMLTRCRNPKASGYEDYGGRGIKVCARWADFANFLVDMGKRPRGTSLERIDNDGDYEPGNCRWATRREQNNNSRHNRHITINGETLIAERWVERAGIEQSTFAKRLAAGWPVDRLLEPVRGCK